MNGATPFPDPSFGFYTGNGPINQLPSTFTTNVNVHQLYPQNGWESNPYHNNTVQRPIQSNHQQQQSTTANVYNFENETSNYYDQIHVQTRKNSANNATNSNAQKPQVNPVKASTLAVPSSHKEPTFLVVPAADMGGTISPFQRPPSSFTPISARSPSTQPTSDADPSLDYLQHTIDSLIQRLVPTDTYIPKVNIFVALQCSRSSV